MSQHAGLRLGVLLGGRSGERPVSLKTGAAVVKALRGRGHDVVEVDPGGDPIAQVRDARVEAVFVALHGRYGEDGVMQGMLEYLDVPYTGSGVLASSIAMDKIVTKRLLSSEGLPTPPFEVVVAPDRPGSTRLPLPVVVKPAREGSSLGITVVREAAALPKALADAAALDDVVLVEAYVRGPELTCSVIGGTDPRALPIIEIRPKSGLYDFASKYTAGATEYLIPPPSLDASDVAVIQSLSLCAHRALGCWGMSRVDFISGPQGPMILEVNTIPGMTETSLLPKSAAAAGISFSDFVQGQIDLALERARKR